ncbi:MAG: hypothetical protein QGI83_15000, partial [Candidatus Latescibacteria bacterium]|nr:hypothetical protein [Candidatus Latescibacterota bacterium]
MVAIAAVIFFGLEAQDAQARANRVPQLPNGSVNGCGNCHVNPQGGGARNSFGQAVGSNFLSQGAVQWGAALANMDSDGDGTSNGAELGDPNGVWQSGQAQPGNASQVTNPGDANSKPTPQQTGPTPDLDGDGRVGFADLIAWARDFRLSAKGEDEYNAAIDLNEDDRVSLTDHLIFAQSFGLSSGSPDFGKTDLPTGPGANPDVEPDLGLVEGSEGTVEGEGAAFGLDLFAEGLVEPLTGLEVVLDLDPSQVAVVDFSVADGISGTLTATTDTSLVIAGGGSTLSFTVGEDGYVGTVTFITTSDVTGVPVHIGLKRMVLADANQKINTPDAAGVEVTMNGVSPPQREAVGQIVRLDLEADLLCLNGVQLFVPSGDIEVELPDGTVSTAAQAALGGQIGPGTRVLVDVQLEPEGQRVALRVRLLASGERVVPGSGQTVGRIQSADLQQGLVQLRPRCVRLTEETVVLEEEAEIGVGDLEVGDRVAVTHADPLPEDSVRVAVRIAVQERAPEPMALVSVSLDGEELVEDAKADPVAAGSHELTMVFSAPLIYEVDDG